MKKTKFKLMFMPIILTILTSTSFGQSYSNMGGTTNSYFEINSSENLNSCSLLFNSNSFSKLWNIENNNGVLNFRKGGTGNSPFIDITDTYMSIQGTLNVESTGVSRIGAIVFNNYALQDVREIKGQNEKDLILYGRQNNNTKQALKIKPDGNVTIVNSGRIQENLTVEGNLTVDGSISGAGVGSSFTFTNAEKPASTPAEGFVYYDRNHNPSGEAGSGFFTGDNLDGEDGGAGGLVLYNYDDGYSALIDTRNMDNLKAKFKTVQTSEFKGPKEENFNMKYVKSDNSSDFALRMEPDGDIRVFKHFIANDDVVIGAPSDASMDNTPYPDYKLWVDGGAVANDIAIAEVTEWEDRVFKEEYDLISLEEVEEHIMEKGHLHTMPSEIEVLKNGYSVEEMDKNLLRTIEELMLHTIEQQKTIDALLDRLEKLEK